MSTSFTTTTVTVTTVVTVTTITAVSILRINLVNPDEFSEIYETFFVAKDSFKGANFHELLKWNDKTQDVATIPCTEPFVGIVKEYLAKHISSTQKLSIQKKATAGEEFSFYEDMSCFSEGKKAFYKTLYDGLSLRQIYLNFSGLLESLDFIGDTIGIFDCKICFHHLVFKGRSIKEIAEIMEIEIEGEEEVIAELDNSARDQQTMMDYSCSTRNMQYMIKDI